ncbi:MAG TPA: type II toxin-antitoxin system Phd/YefM family antitoxin, partial [Candidatus Hydrogenedentes bacterium]|nr:type II toxin-antitoxin system Phd/YefM family antitoxin [Candidatus Hydrogenedentota bacterium]
MTTVPSDKARENLSGLVDEVAASHQPVQIVGGDHAAVLVAEEDWRAIQ